MSSIENFGLSPNFPTVYTSMCDVGKVINVPTTGFSYTLANSTSIVIFEPAGTLASGTITMPAAPLDGQIVRFSSSQIITALTVLANSGQSIVGAITTLALGDAAAYIYHLAGTKWYRYN